MLLEKRYGTMAKRENRYVCTSLTPTDWSPTGWTPQVPVAPMCTLRAKPIGIMNMLDNGEKDNKVIAVCSDDPEFKDYNDISELPPFRIAEIRGFFQDYKKLEGKVVSVEELEGRDSGVRAVKEAMDLYTAMVVRDLQS
jgi:inorganic pyrophosphatase